MMEDVPTTSSLHREGEVGNRTPAVPVRKIPEPTYLTFDVCKRPISELSRITVAQLTVNERATGNYLLLRTLEPTVTGELTSDFGRNALVQVEDHDGNSFPCCLYAHVHLRTETELKEMLPVNTVFALREPLLTAWSEGESVVVVGSPTDFVVVGLNHVLSKDVEALGWREKTEVEGLELTWKWSRIAADLFEKGKFDDASDAYLFALNNCTEDFTTLNLNQNLTNSFLAQECYESSIKHALNVLALQPLNEIALYCAGRANYELREYRKARSYFQTLSRENPTNPNYSAQLGRCAERLLYAEGNDHGNYQQGVDFQACPCNERGVLATRDMMPGTMVLVEKPVVEIFVPRNSSERGTVRLMRTALKAVFKNPKTLGQCLYSLPGGGVQTDENKKIFCDEENELEPIVDVSRLHQTIHRNILKTKTTMEDTPFTYQVYELASRFQHSCISNCAFTVYKDEITVRTCSPVKEGEELSLRYYGNHAFYHEKQRAFQRNGFTCECRLCELDQAEEISVHYHRELLTTKFYDQLKTCATVPHCAEKTLLPIVEELDQTYSQRSELRLFLFMVYVELAKVVDRSNEGWETKLALYAEKGLKSVGLSIDTLLVCTEQANSEILRCILIPELLFDYAGLMAEVESSCGYTDLVQQWVQVLVNLETIYKGGSMETLRNRLSGFRQFPTLLSRFDI